MLALDEARARILAAVAPLGPETVALSESWNRVLARPVVARLTQPPAPVSAMDGYALHAADGVLGARLKVVGSSPAGHPFRGSVGAGEAIRVFTGGVVPEGLDAILLQEDATAEGEWVIVNEAVKAGRWIRRKGLDFSEGEELIRAGQRMSARYVGLAAAANHPWLTVYRAPRVAIIATGDEIVLPGEKVPEGGIVSSNAHALAALVKAAGGVPLVLPVAPDTEEGIAALAEAGRHCDLIVTTGGASVGEHDLVQKALGPQGFALDFWQIAMRPGKPLIWGRLGQTPVLGLPGNPVSALICAVQFMLPVLAVMQGQPGGEPPTRQAVAGAAIGENDKRFDHLRATLAVDGEGRLVATPFATQDSSMLATLARAEGLVLRAPFAPAVEAGAPVRVVVLGDLGV
ncbi:molybdopterin molybdotransferase MoeA [Acetobacteraceae bacterium H6797]|nr:molybdopterin molybdotransferase MoeA [Acetobacteraceae bacterium H6797]